MQYRRAAVEDDGLVLVAVEVDDLLALGDRGQGLRGQAEGFKGFGSGMKLAQAAIDEDERGEGLGFLGAGSFGLPGPRIGTGGTRFIVQLFEEAAIAARDYLAHGGEVVDAGHCLDFEFAIGLLVHLAVFPDHHRGHGLSALDVGDVEALDAAGTAISMRWPVRSVSNADRVSRSSKPVGTRMERGM